MKDDSYRLLLGLLLIKRVESSRNSYGLTRILSWKFGIIDIVDFTYSLTNDKLIEAKYVKGIEYYKLTDLGETYLANNIPDPLYNELISRNPDQLEYVSALIKRTW